MKRQAARLYATCNHIVRDVRAKSRNPRTLRWDLGQSACFEQDAKAGDRCPSST